MNNAWQQLFQTVLLTAKIWSKEAEQDAKKKQQEPDHPLSIQKLLDVVKYKMKLNWLHTKTKAWEDDGKNESDLRSHYRFTGLES